MRITFLGTASAEGYPALFCECENCQRARQTGGRDLRMRAAALINQELIFDWGPDLLAAAQRGGLRLSQLEHLLITHAHGDHLNLTNFDLRRPPFRAQELPVLHVYAHPTVLAVMDRLPELAPELRDGLRLERHPVEIGQRFQAGRYRALALPARHPITGSVAICYALSDGQRSILYATDTGVFPEQVWPLLSGWRFHLAVMEQTMGHAETAGHLNLTQWLEHKERLEKEGMTAPGCRFLATHIGHHWNPGHQELERALARRGGELAYDGLVVEV